METPKPKGNALKVFAVIIGAVLLTVGMATIGQFGSWPAFIAGLVLLVVGAAETPAKEKVKPAEPAEPTDPAAAT
jgi:hypothetical protein